MNTMHTPAFKRCLNYALLTAGCVIIGLATIADFPILFPALSLIGLSLTWWLSRHDREPSLLIGNLLIVVALSALVLIWIRTGRFEVFDFMTQLLLIALIVKFLITNKVNDLLWLAITIFFLVAAVAISTTGLVFIPFMLGYLILQGQLFNQWNALRLYEISKKDLNLCIQVSVQSVNQLGIETKWYLEDEVMPSVLSSAVVHKNWCMVWLSILLCTLLAIPVFFYIPRFSTNNVIPPIRVNPSLLDNGTQGENTGFSDIVDLGWDGTDIGISMETVAYARPNGPPHKMQVRLRGTALDEFNGKRWKRTTFAFLHTQQRRFSRANYEMHGMSIIQNAKCGKYLFSESFADRFMTPKGCLVYVDVDAGACVLSNESYGRELRYKTNSAVEYLEMRVNPVQILKDISKNEHGEYPLQAEYQIDMAYYQKCLQIPDLLDRQRMLALLTSWVTPDAGPFETAMAVEKRLQQDYRYGLKTSAVPRTAQPVEWFLYNSKEGHCEYFASAMTLMMRAKGIPARVITGYVSTEWNSGAEAFVIRQSDAHSWVEVYFDNYGWMTFDPTPAAGISRRTHVSPWMREFMSAMDTLRMQWYRYVIDYDITNQYKWIGRIDHLFGRVIFFPRQLYHTWVQKKQQIRSIAWLLMTAGSLFVLVIVLCLVGRKLKYRRRTNQLTGDRAASPQACRNILYRQVLMWIKMHFNLLRKSSETPLEFAERIENQQRRTSLRQFTYLTNVYYRIRFGKTVLSAIEKEKFKDFVSHKPPTKNNK